MSSPYDATPPLRHAHAAPGMSSPAPIPCRKCGRAIDFIDIYCKFCGTRQQETAPFYYHPVWILVLAFVVLGPFALGLVWRSRVMSPATKGILAVIIVAYSVFSLYSLYVVGAAVYQQFSLLDQIM